MAPKNSTQRVAPVSHEADKKGLQTVVDSELKRDVHVFQNGKHIFTAGLMLRTAEQVQAHGPPVTTYKAERQMDNDFVEIMWKGSGKDINEEQAFQEQLKYYLTHALDIDHFLCFMAVYLDDRNRESASM